VTAKHFLLTSHIVITNIIIIDIDTMLSLRRLTAFALASAIFLISSLSSIDAQSGDSAYTTALGTARAPLFSADFSSNITANGGATNWRWLSSDSSDSSTNQGVHTGLAQLTGAATSFINLNAVTGPNRVGSTALPMMGGLSQPGAGYTAGWSVEVVFKTSGIANWAKIYNLGTGPGETLILLGWDGDADGQNLLVENYNDAAIAPNYVKGAVEVVKPTILNKWYHIVWNFIPVDQAASSANWQIYVNGQLQNWANGITPNTTFTPIQGANYPLRVDRDEAYLGKSSWNDPTMAVIYDAFRVYDYALTAQQVRAFATAYNCYEPVTVPTPANNFAFPDSPESLNWNTFAPRAPVMNAVFSEDPITAVGGRRNYGYMSVDGVDAPAVQAFHRGITVFNGSDSSYVDLTTHTGPLSIGRVMPIFGVTSGVGPTAGTTVSIVVKLTAVEVWAKIIELSSGPYYDSWVIGWNGNTYNSIEVHNFNEVRAGVPDLGVLNFLRSPVLNQWYHFSVVMQQLDSVTYRGNWTIYVNGEIAATLLPTAAVDPANYPLPVYRQNSYIANSAWGADETATMELDMFRVYDYALTQAQVRGEAAAYGLYGPNVPVDPSWNVTFNFPADTESQGAASKVSRQPVMNAWFGTDPTVATRSSSVGLNYVWMQIDPSDNGIDQQRHKGLIRLTGAPTSYIDLATSLGPNSCGVVLPIVGGPGYGTGSNGFGQGWTFEVVFKILGADNWAKIFNFGNGPEIDNIILGWDGADVGALAFENWNSPAKPAYPHGMAGVFEPKLGKWYHVVIVVEPVDLTAGSANWIFYVNGQRYDYSTQITPGKSFTPIQGGSYPFANPRPRAYLGESNWNDPNMNMILDAMRVYDYALTGTQIRDLADFYGLNEPAMALTTPALNNPNVNPANNAEVNAWNIANANMPTPVFNAPFAVNPGPLVNNGGAVNYTWMESDPTDSTVNQQRHRGIVALTGNAGSFIDLMKPTGPNSVGLVLPTLFGQSSGSDSTLGWTVECAFKSDRADVWSKIVGFSTGADRDAWSIGWYGAVANAFAWEVQNHNNVNPGSSVIREISDLVFWNSPPLNTWVHVVVGMRPIPPFSTYGAVYSVWVNGVLFNETSTNVMMPFPVYRHQSYLGASAWAHDPNAKVYFDALRIYDKHLTPAQVASLAALYGASPPPQASTGSNQQTRTSSSSSGTTVVPGTDSSSSSSLSGGAIAGIVIGSIAGAAILCALIFCFLFSGRSSKNNSSKDADNNYGNNANNKYGQMEASTTSAARGDDVELAHVENETA